MVHARKLKKKKKKYFEKSHNSRALFNPSKDSQSIAFTRIPECNWNSFMHFLQPCKRSGRPPCWTSCARRARPTRRRTSRSPGSPAAADTTIQAARQLCLSTTQPPTAIRWPRNSWHPSQRVKTRRSCRQPSYSILSKVRKEEKFCDIRHLLVCVVGKFQWQVYTEELDKEKLSNFTLEMQADILSL